MTLTSNLSASTTPDITSVYYHDFFLIITFINWFAQRSEVNLLGFSFFTCVPEMELKLSVLEASTFTGWAICLTDLHAWLMWCWGWNPDGYEYEASILSTESHPQFSIVGEWLWTPGSGNLGELFTRQPGWQTGHGQKGVCCMNKWERLVVPAPQRSVACFSCLPTRIS